MIIIKPFFLLYWLKAGVYNFIAASGPADYSISARVSIVFYCLTVRELKQENTRKYVMCLTQDNSNILIREKLHVLQNQPYDSEDISNTCRFTR